MGTGPSGAGKTCFLDILSYRKTLGTMGGKRTLNGTPLDQRSLKAMSSYVTQVGGLSWKADPWCPIDLILSCVVVYLSFLFQQEDIFHPTTTVLEAIMFQAQMRLDARMPYNEKLARVTMLIKLAGLSGKVQVSPGSGAVALNPEVTYDTSPPNMIFYCRSLSRLEGYFLVVSISVACLVGSSGGYHYAAEPSPTLTSFSLMNQLQV